MEELIKSLVEEAEVLKDKYTDQKNIPVYYACIFCQSEREFNHFVSEAQKIGKVVQERPNSFLFRIPVIKTVAGRLELIRIRRPDVLKPERGDADFIVSDYDAFKKRYIKKSGFSIIPRGNSEMIELYKEGENVRVYFSAPFLIKELQSL